MVVCFFELTLFYFGSHNFFNSVSFLMIFNVTNAPRGGVQVLFRHKKKWSLPLGFGLPWTLKCSLVGLLYSCNSICYSITTQFATKEQLKNLTHMLCLWISCYILYKRGLLSYVLTLKCIYHFGMNSKKT